MWRSVCGLGVAGAFLLLCSTSFASETRSYGYDALGRLTTVTVSSSGGSGQNVALSYDPAGNRTHYTMGSTTSSGGSSGGSSSGGTGTIAVTNPSMHLSSAQAATIALTDLATLNGRSGKITVFSPPSGDGSATIASGGASVTYTAPTMPTPGYCEPAQTISFSIPYTVQDTGSGSTYPGNVSMSVTGPKGPRPTPPQVCP